MEFLTSTDSRCFKADLCYHLGLWISSLDTKASTWAKSSVISLDIWYAPKLFTPSGTGSAGAFFFTGESSVTFFEKIFFKKSVADYFFTSGFCADSAAAFSASNFCCLSNLSY
jgi:hypothetical protein